jgi:hypothetical protein
VAQDEVNLTKLWKFFRNNQKVGFCEDVNCSDFVPNWAGLGEMICDRKNLAQMGEAPLPLQ